MTSVDFESRLRAIAANAVREAMLAYGRWDRPFTDDDAGRIENIYQILHLSEPQTGYEHAPLASIQAPYVESSVRKVADLLANLPEDSVSANSGLEDPAIKASLPRPAKKSVDA